MRPPVNDNIDNLVKAFQRGEEKGFTYFFNELYPALLYFAFRILNDKAAAKDIVEESFIKIWERHTSFTHHKVIKSWLYTTVRNGCIDLQRKQQTNMQREEELASMTKTTETHAMQEMIRAEVASEIYNAITNLPPRCRQVFRLIYIEGKTLKQTAQEMQLSVNTVKNHRTHGLSLLKKRAPDFF
jgi:RNA polymerase sigma-70 factor (family 1)